MKKKKIVKVKIRLGNLALMLLMISCFFLMIHDFYMMTIFSYVTGSTVGWTWFGFGTFLLAASVGSILYDYFFEKDVEE